MKFVPLGSVAHIQLGKMLSPKAKTGTASFPYLRNQNVQWQRFDLIDLSTMDFFEQEREKFKLMPGDLLICEGGEPGRCAVWDGRLTNCYYQKALHRLRPHKGVADAEFLALWIRFQSLTGAFEDQNAKTTIAHLPLVRLEQLPVPGVGIDEQHEIATRLKAQLAEVERAHQAAKAQLRDARLLSTRMINAVFDSIDASLKMMDDVLLDIQAGKSFLTSEVLARPDELGVLKVSAVTWTDFRADEAKALIDAYDPAESHKVRKNDLIVSRANTKEFVGAVVLVGMDYPYRLLSDKTLRLVVDEEQVCKEYLLLALRSSVARKHIERFATGTSDSMRNISHGVIRGIPIRLPQMADQRKVAARLRAQLGELEKACLASEAQLKEIERLPSRILAQEFEFKYGKNQEHS